MRKIEVGVLQESPNAAYNSSFLAKLTQRGHELTNLQSVLDLYHQPKNYSFVQKLASMDHGTVKRMDSYTVVVVGASRRFLAQIRTHQHADFMSGSLQYSDWSDSADYLSLQDIFVVPYAFYKDEAAKLSYLRECSSALSTYQKLAKVDHDAAGFIMPNGLRNVLVIHANVQQWQYMIKVRTCKRNSDETRYVMLKIWDALLNQTECGQNFFNPAFVGTDCALYKCREGKFTCGKPINEKPTPIEIIQQDYPLCLEA